MPRRAREPSKTRIYHVMIRGNEKKNIFQDVEDKQRFLDIVNEKKEDGKDVLYAYCIMDNHAHLLLREESQPLSLVMKRIGTSYAYYYNKKHKRVGHVFQDRFRSENVEDERYFLSVLRYIHNNPEKAGICLKEKYLWSSYNAFIKGKDGLIRTGEVNEVLGLFSQNRSTAVEMFSEFCSQEGAMDHLDIKEDNDEKMAGEEVQIYLRKFLQERGIDQKDLRNRKLRHVRDELLVELRKNTDLSLREIAELVGVSKELARKVVLLAELPN